MTTVACGSADRAPALTFRYNWLPLCVFAGAYAVALWLALNPAAQWVQPEVYHWIPTATDPNYQAWMSMFDWPAFERAPRFTRPLSSLITVFDFRLRAFLWQFTEPMPALSLTWLACFAFSPAALYVFLRQKLDAGHAILGVAIFVVSPATLSLAAMLFRPGKAFAISCLLIALAVWARAERAGRVTLTTSAIVSFVMLCGLLCDEIGAVIPILGVVLFWRSILDRPSLALPPLAACAIYSVLVFWVIPTASVHLGIDRPHETYGPLLNAMHPRPFSNLIPMASVAWTETFGGIWDAHNSFILAAEVCVAAVLAISTIRHASNDWKPVAASLAACVAATLFANALLQTDRANNLWGAYWYNTFLIVPGVLFVVTATSRFVTTFATISIVALSVATFPATNNAYRYYHYRTANPADLTSVFKGALDRFSIKADAADLDKLEAKNYVAVPVELAPLFVELGIGRPPPFCARKGTFTSRNEGKNYDCD